MFYQAPKTSPKILIVDDDPDITLALADFLQNQGYRIETASTGQEAINRVSSEHFDAVLLDIRLPDRDGWDVLGHASIVAPHLPVILHTAQMVSERLDSEAARSGAFALLPKPFNRHKVALTLRRAVALTVASQPA